MEEEIKRYSQNRELSWLAFNDRVLDEATDESVPLLERLKFVSIFTANLDEFFMIRVGSLYDILSMDDRASDRRTGMTVSEQLERIYAAVRPLCEKRDRIYGVLKQELANYQIADLRPEELTQEEQTYLKQYFKEEIFPLLSPQIVDYSHPFPHLINQQIYVVANLTRKKETMLGIVPVSDMLPEIVNLPGEGVRFVRMETLIETYMEKIFEQYQVSDTNSICVTRNADISPDDELFEVEDDFRNHMKKLLHKRRRMAVVRLETARPLERKMEEILLKRCQISKAQIFQTETPMRMDYVYSIPANIPISMARALVYPAYTPQITIPGYQGNMLKLARKQDLLLSFPYESMDPFLQMIREAGTDPDVLSIKITIYRLAKNARLVEYLCAAAENGKEVTVLIELRARFDEQNNIDWSERLETAGCRVLYGFETYKVHSKICLLTMRDRKGLQYITQIGTGNYNEKTARLYADLSLITADPRIGRDAVQFFKNMSIGNLEGNYQHLLVSPKGLKPALLRLVEEETEKGAQGHIVIKCNAVTDCAMIEALSRASRAGVKVELIVRGICCILPDVAGYTQGITVTSIVGRYLEHARIYAFGDGEDRKILIGSADLMTRNTERRVEVITPVYDPTIKRKLEDYLEIQLHDTVKARRLTKTGVYERVENKTGTPAVCAQEELMAQAIREGAASRAQSEASPSKSVRPLRSLIQRLKKR